MTATRLDTDSLGSLAIDADALFGVQSVRGRDNFAVSGMDLGDSPLLVRAFARIKHAAAAANRNVGVVPRDVADAIVAAAVEVEGGAHADQFIIDMLEGSGGTSLNMNVNEVLANRALQLLGDAPGNHARVHPNDHVNAGQSTNDVVPSAAKLAVHDASGTLVEALRHLAATLDERATRFADVLRAGRTCMQAAQPMRLGQAFGGYAAGVRRCAVKLATASADLLVLPLGGTAIGTGLGAAPGYRDAVYVHLRDLVDADVRPGDDPFDAMQSADTFARVSSEMRIAADVVARIAADLIVLSSDGGAGIGELRLPKVQPGSSIMPGKVNPVMPMMMQQVAFLVAGNHASVSLAALHGQMEINHFEPLITTRLLESAGVFARAARLFADRCIVGIEADRERSLANLMRSSAISTVFVPRLGYDAVARLVGRSGETGVPLVDLAVEEGLLTREEVMDVLWQSTAPPV